MNVAEEFSVRILKLLVIMVRYSLQPSFLIARHMDVLGVGILQIVP
jgi:hypothetical protein